MDTALLPLLSALLLELQKSRMQLWSCGLLILGIGNLSCRYLSWVGFPDIIPGELPRLIHKRKARSNTKTQLGVAWPLPQRKKQTNTFWCLWYFKLNTTGFTCLSLVFFFPQSCAINNIKKSIFHNWRHMVAETYILNVNCLPWNFYIPPRYLSWAHWNILWIFEKMFPSYKDPHLNFVVFRFPRIICWRKSIFLSSPAPLLQQIKW